MIMTSERMNLQNDLAIPAITKKASERKLTPSEAYSWEIWCCGNFSFAHLLCGLAPKKVMLRWRTDKREEVRTATQLVIAFPARQKRNGSLNFRKIVSLLIGKNQANFLERWIYPKVAPLCDTSDGIAISQLPKTMKDLFRISDY